MERISFSYWEAPVKQRQALKYRPFHARGLRDLGRRLFHTSTLLKIQTLLESELTAPTMQRGNAGDEDPSQNPVNLCGLRIPSQRDSTSPSMSLAAVESVCFAFYSEFYILHYIVKERK